MALINSDEAHARMNSGWHHIDVRDPQAFSRLHAPGSVNIPFSMVAAHSRIYGVPFLAAVTRAYRKNDKIIISCADGSLSTPAVLRLSAAGYKHLRVVYGGMNAWCRYKRLPVVKKQ
eukprot:IDg20824t1